MSMPNQMPKKKLTRYLQKHEKVRFQIWQTWGSCYWGRGRRQPTRVGRSQRHRVFDSAIFTFIIPIHELLVEMLILGGFLKWWVSPTGPWVLFRNKKGSALGVWNGGKPHHLRNHRNINFVQESLGKNALLGCFGLFWNTKNPPHMVVKNGDFHPNRRIRCNIHPRWGLTPQSNPFIFRPFIGAPYCWWLKSS